MYSAVEHPEVITAERAFFPSQPLDKGLAFEFQQRGMCSLRVAEQCKFPHVTYFFNGFNSGLEGREICIPSLPDRLLKHHPEMSLPQITAALLSALSARQEKVIIANISNLDQIGHLGSYELAAKAARLVDEALQTVHAAAHAAHWSLMITSDHGNADLMNDCDGHPVGSHSPRPVPLVIVPDRPVRFAWTARAGTLANVAASLLTTLDMEPPSWMASSLIARLA